jgi:hypothetical protein
MFSIKSILVQQNVVEWAVQGARSGAPTNVSTASNAPEAAKVAVVVASVLALLRRSNVMVHTGNSLIAARSAKEAKAQRALFLKQLQDLSGEPDAAAAVTAESAAVALYLEGLHSATLEAALVACRHVGILRSASQAFRLLPGMHTAGA